MEVEKKYKNDKGSHWTKAFLYIIQDKSRRKETGVERLTGDEGRKGKKERSGGGERNLKRWR